MTREEPEAATLYEEAAAELERAIGQCRRLDELARMQARKSILPGD